MRTAASRAVRRKGRWIGRNSSADVMSRRPSVLTKKRADCQVEARVSKRGDEAREKERGGRTWSMTEKLARTYRPASSSCVPAQPAHVPIHCSRWLLACCTT